MAQLLIDAKAEVKAINKKFFAPLHTAVVFYKNQETINLLYPLHFPKPNQPKNEEA